MEDVEQLTIERIEPNLYNGNMLTWLRMSAFDYKYVIKKSRKMRFLLLLRFNSKHIALRFSLLCLYNVVSSSIYSFHSLSLSPYYLSLAFYYNRICEIIIHHSNPCCSYYLIIVSNPYVQVSQYVTLRHTNYILSNYTVKTGI